MKKILAYIFIFFVFLFFGSTKVSAQTPPAQGSEIWRCLRGDNKTFQFTGAGNTTFSQDLYADGFPLGSEVYIVSCTGTSDGSSCTTGNPDYDRLLFNYDNTTTFPYKVEVTGGSRQAADMGRLHATVTISTEGLVGGMVFFGVTVGEVPTDQGNGPGQKLSVFSFSDPVTTNCVNISWNTVFPPPPPPPPPPPGGTNSVLEQYPCLQKHTCRWDPFGIVFDSQSLEPLPNVKITILDSNKDKYQLLGLTNPQVTAADGLFNFLVEPGVYYLAVVPTSGYTFTATPNLQPNYIKIYHKMDGSNSIYKPGDPITEEIDTPEEVAQGYPNMEHRDIPLDPGSNPPYRAQPTTISYSASRLGDTTTIDGKVSIPFTKVSFSQGSILMVTVQSDRFGYYSVNLNNAAMNQNEDITVTYTKVDLTTVAGIRMSQPLANSFFKDFLSQIFSPIVYPVLAQTHLQIPGSRHISPSPTFLAQSSFNISPIPAYIEGYAYDQNGDVLPRAEVDLKLDMNNATYYKTFSDNQGYFFIDPKYIPLFSYHLEIIPNGSGIPAINYTTSEFAKKNQAFLDKNNIDLLTATKNNKPIATYSGELKNQGNIKSQTVGQTPSRSTSTQTSKIGTVIFVVLLILLLLILLGATVFYIIKQKNQIPPNGQST